MLPGCLLKLGIEVSTDVHVAWHGMLRLSTSGYLTRYIPSSVCIPFAVYQAEIEVLAMTMAAC